ncbi:MAG TPA: HAD-IIA family hydrolase, partial [Actinomycetota bacterium]|nr:HAD-IIA family hydrolase [Actinomycetota bacterium]
MLAARYDALLFDLDGVLYRGDEPVPGAPETMAALRAAGANIVFLTNNSSRTPEQVSAKLGAMGMHSAPAEVVTSATATADLLAARDGGTAFVMGGDGVVGALRDAGLQVVDGEPEAVDLVVVGIDDDLTYARLRTACILVHRGASFVATNADPTFPATGGELWPGAGALVAAITTATGVQAEVVGKPHAPLFHAALRRAGGLNPLVIGDRLDTDIASGRQAGCNVHLVLSGVTAEAPTEVS